jgi:FKBP-type peptidyl-prolyl cis-trans isomerase FkpA
MKQLLSILMLSLILLSCGKKKAEEQAKIDDDLIQQYLTENGLTATKTSSGLYYLIETQGAGQSCTGTSDVTVAYKGYYTNDAVFDESDQDGATFNLQSVIKGWTEGIPYFKEGGNGKLFIPSALGYGDKNNGPIPANSVLIFDVALLEVL